MSDKMSSTSTSSLSLCPLSVGELVNNKLLLIRLRIIYISRTKTTCISYISIRGTLVYNRKRIRGLLGYFIYGLLAHLT